MYWRKLSSFLNIAKGGQFGKSKRGKKNDFNQLQVEIVQPIKKTKDFVVVVIPLFCFSVFLLFPNRTVNKSVSLIMVDLNKDQ